MSKSGKPVTGRPQTADARAQEQESLSALGARLAEVARENAIPLDADNALTGRLAQVAPAEQIPEHVYSGVAALLAFLRESEEQADR